MFKLIIQYIVIILSIIVELIVLVGIADSVDSV
jgi:hypothetical protein